MHGCAGIKRSSRVVGSIFRRELKGKKKKKKKKKIRDEFREPREVFTTRVEKRSQFGGQSSSIFVTSVGLFKCAKCVMDDANVRFGYIRPISSIVFPDNPFCYGCK